MAWCAAASQRATGFLEGRSLRNSRQSIGQDVGRPALARSWSSSSLSLPSRAPFSSREPLSRTSLFPFCLISLASSSLLLLLLAFLIFPDRPRRASARFFISRYISSPRRSFPTHFAGDACSVCALLCASRTQRPRKSAAIAS